ncbi:MAG: hypothetical protein KDA37_03105 [Planctomycetales bacterium]|nr:hypothetical protein [Planctomycetales bacterium]
MGMDVFGREPSAECGEYFRANIWGWGPLHSLMEETCSDLLGEELITAMSYNEGQGPDGQDVCTAMADRLERAVGDQEREFVAESSLRVDAKGRLLSDEEIAGMAPGDTFSPYRIDAEFVRKWIQFLRHCGGFSVF